jgi:hypothetical protein
VKPGELSHEKSAEERCAYRLDGRHSVMMLCSSHVVEELGLAVVYKPGRASILWLRANIRNVGTPRTAQWHWSASGTPTLAGLRARYTQSAAGW